jgi:arylsulfatase A-like enzyme
MRTDEGPLPGMDHVLPMGTDCTTWRDWLAARGYQNLPDDAQFTYLMRDEDPKWREAGLPAPLAFPAEHSDTRFMVDALLDWVGAQHDGALPDGAPGWMAHLSLVRPHPPWIAPVPYNTLYPPDRLPGYRRAADVAAESAQHPWLAWFLAGRRNAAHADQRRHGLLQASYYGLMNEVDDNPARLFEALKANGDWDRTLIVLTSDHGEQMGDHWMLGKAGYFDQSYHVPLFVRDPEPAADRGRGALLDVFSEHVDLMPTVLDWIGVPVPRQCDGQSLLSMVRGAPAPADWRDAVHWEFDFRDPVDGEAEEALGLHMDQCTLNVRRTRHWKYVHFSSLPPLLFDLAADPDELHDLAGDPAAAHVLSEQARALLSWRMRHADKTLTHMRIVPNTGLVVAQG